jgi:hypothetical protein
MLGKGSLGNLPRKLLGARAIRPRQGDWLACACPQPCRRAAAQAGSFGPLAFPQGFPEAISRLDRAQSEFHLIAVFPAWIFAAHRRDYARAHEVSTEGTPKCSGCGGSPPNKGSPINPSSLRSGDVLGSEAHGVHVAIQRKAQPSLLSERSEARVRAGLRV